VEELVSRRGQADIANILLRVMSGSDRVWLTPTALWESVLWESTLWDAAWHASTGERRTWMNPASARDALLVAGKYVDEKWTMLGEPTFLATIATGCGGVVFRRRVAFLSEPPIAISRDGQGRLHAVNGPAVEWPDGFVIHALHGVQVPARVIDAPHSLDPATVLAEPNLEVRRTMIELIGYEHLLAGLGTEPVASDECGRLWRVEMNDEPLTLAEVTNSTLEPDGTRKRYFLRVPPSVFTPRQAVAWTFGMTADEYAPAVET
jgi:hypothetical protein